MIVDRVELLNQQRSLYGKIIVLTEDTFTHKDQPRADIKKGLHQPHGLKQAKKIARIAIL